MRAYCFEVNASCGGIINIHALGVKGPKGDAGDLEVIHHAGIGGPIARTRKFQG